MQPDLFEANGQPTPAAACAAQGMPEDPAPACSAAAREKVDASRSGTWWRPNTALRARQGP